mmetsp:Transcript_28334/g.90767  ORF Transcript_28334/g.90767 Transcript_28334/m.90767 type:complete len:230 (-) Transcript_28334:149-838(-)
MSGHRKLRSVPRPLVHGRAEGGRLAREHERRLGGVRRELDRTNGPVRQAAEEQPERLKVDDGMRAVALLLAPPRAQSRVPHTLEEVRTEPPHFDHITRVAAAHRHRDVDRAGSRCRRLHPREEFRRQRARWPGYWPRLEEGRAPVAAQEDVTKNDERHECLVAARKVSATRSKRGRARRSVRGVGRPIHTLPRIELVAPEPARPLVVTAAVRPEAPRRMRELRNRHRHL